MRAAANPFYTARRNRPVAPVNAPVEKIVIGNATAYRGDCFDILPQLSCIGAAVTSLFRFGLELRYGYGGLGGPIRVDNPGHANLESARTAGLEQLLRSWHTPFPSDPESVRDELSAMREQVKSRLRQPSLF